MKIQTDNKFSKELLDKIYKYHTEGREDRSTEWHVSDLLFPRYAVLQRLEGVTPTTEDVGFFFTGEAYHQLTQKILGNANSEIRMKLHNVLGTADYLSDDTLIELKTSRKWTIDALPANHYVEQIEYYAAMSGKKEAKIVVIYPVAGRKWDGSAASSLEIVTWALSWSDEEIEAIKAKMKNVVASLDKAAKNRDLSELPACPDWKYGAIVQDKETREYLVKVRCTFANRELCRCSPADVLKEEAARKNSRVGSRGGKRGF